MFCKWENQPVFFVFRQWNWDKVSLICGNNLGFSCRMNKEDHGSGDETFYFPREQDSSYRSVPILDQKEGEINGLVACGNEM